MKKNMQKIGAIIGAMIELLKPRLTALVVFTTLAGAYLSETHLAETHLAETYLAELNSTGSIVFSGLFSTTLIACVFAMVLIVGGANSINMYMEIEIDAQMLRTQSRPIQQGILSKAFVLSFGLLLCVLGLVLVFVWVNYLAGALALVASLLYLFAYTPMKQRSPLALWVGAIPGAAPVLIGYVAVTNRLDYPGLGLFALLFFWQIPHFMAIAIYRGQEYFAAGLKVIGVSHGLELTRYQLIPYAGILIPVSLVLSPLLHLSIYYWAPAIFLGLFQFAYSVRGLFVVSDGIDEAQEKLWARKYFFITVVYLPLLFMFMILDRYLPSLL